MSFDAENRLTSYGSVLTAGYTGDGLRAWKQTASGRTYFVYDGTLPVLEIDQSGAVTATNTFGAHGLVSRHVSTQSTFYTFDAQGNVTQRLDASQTVQSSHFYSAHGAELSTASTEPFGYGGQRGYYTDRETGLQLLTHRYYDSQSGRFLTRDPISYRGGVNLYAYAHNNAIRYRDPNGTEVGEGIIAGAELGAEIGTLIEPGGGTAIGGILGGIIGGAGEVAEYYFAFRMIANAIPASPPPSVAVCHISHSYFMSKNGDFTKLSDGEIGKLKDKGINPHDLKPDPPSRYDLYKNKDGEIWWKGKGGLGEGEDTGYNINDF